MGKLNLGLQRNKEGRIIRDDGDGGTKAIKGGGPLSSGRYAPGQYIAKVRDVILRAGGPKNRGGSTFIVETECMEVVSARPAPAGTPPTKVGDKPSVLYSSKGLSYVDDVARAGLAVLGFTVDTLPVDEDPEALCDEVTIDTSDASTRGQKSPAAGNYVLVDAWEGKDKEGEENGFINTRLYPVPEELKAKYKNAFPGE